MIAETRFLGFWGFLVGIQKPGFFAISRWGCVNSRRNPVSWILGFPRGDSETGFLRNISVGMFKLSQKPGFLDFGVSSWGFSEKLLKTF
jgi:hypothetical protein